MKKLSKSSNWNDEATQGLDKLLNRAERLAKIGSWNAHDRLAAAGEIHDDFAKAICSLAGAVRELERRLAKVEDGGVKP